MVVEEPGLAEHQRGGRQGDREPAAGDHDERHEPFEVLRREDLGEGEETGDRGGERDREALLPSRARA